MTAKLDLGEFNNLVENMVDLIDGIGRQAAKDGASFAKKTLKAKIKHRDKNLANAINPRRESNNSWIINATGEPSKYEKWVHNGRGAVKAKKGKVLHWVADDGTDVYVKYSSPFGGYKYYNLASVKVQRNAHRYVTEASRELGII